MYTAASTLGRAVIAGTRGHIKGALAAGATPEEIMETLKLRVAQGVHSCNLGIPTLTEELDRRQSNDGIG